MSGHVEVLGWMWDQLKAEHEKEVKMLEMKYEREVESVKRKQQASKELLRKITEQIQEGDQGEK